MNNTKKKIVIGIDAFFLFEKHNTGIGWLNYNIISQLAKLDQTNRYILYTPKINHHKGAREILKNPNFIIKETKGIFSGFRRIWLQSFKLKRNILMDNIDIFWGGGEYIPVLLPKKIVTLCTIHDLVFLLFPKTLSLTNRLFYFLLFPISLRRVDHFIAISNDSAADIKNKLKINEDKITVIPNGINLDQFSFDPSIKKSDFILFVGTLQPRKNLENLIKAYILIHNRINTKLIVVGASGWKNSKIKSLVESLSKTIRKNIEFKGYISNEELVKLYRSARIFVAPSLHEGFGLIIAEAMACGTPVITAPVGAIPEIFGDVPLYIDPLSPDDIASKIIHLLSNENLQKKMIREGNELIQKYNINSVALKCKELFEQIINKRGDVH